MGFERGLVAFGEDEVVGVFLVNEEPRVLALAVLGIGGDERAVQRQRFKERAEGGDLLGFFRDGDLVEQALGMMGDGAHQVHGAAVGLARAFDGFAVDGECGEFLRIVLGHPPGEQLVELCAVEPFEGTAEGGLAGHHELAGLFVGRATQVAALRLAEQRGKRGEAFRAAFAGDGGGGGDGQDGGEQVALAAAGARIGEVVVVALPERAEFFGFIGRAHGRLRHLRGEFGRQRVGAQPGAGLHQALIVECEAAMDTQTKLLAPQTTAEPPPPAKRSSQPDEQLRRMLFAKFGVDLTAVDGVAAQTALVFLSEVGPDVSKFATAEHFAWRGVLAEPLRPADSTRTVRPCR